MFFLTFMSLFSLIVFLGLTLAENGATINNEDRKESETRKMLTFTLLCNF